MSGLLKEGRGTALALRKQIEADHTSDERSESRRRYQFDRPVRDAQKITAAHAAKLEAQLLDIDSLTQCR